MTLRRAQNRGMLPVLLISTVGAFMRSSACISLLFWLVVLNGLRISLPISPNEEGPMVGLTRFSRSSVWPPTMEASSLWCERSAIAIGTWPEKKQFKVDSRRPLTTARRTLRCPRQNNLQSESGSARPCRYWGPRDYHCLSQAPRPQSLVGWEICQPQRPVMTIESLSVRKTSAWRRSMPSTRKAKAKESLSVKRRFRTSAWRRSTPSTKKPKAQLNQT